MRGFRRSIRGTRPTVTCTNVTESYIETLRRVPNAVLTSDVYTDKTVFACCLSNAPFKHHPQRFRFPMRVKPASMAALGLDSTAFRDLVHDSEGPYACRQQGRTVAQLLLQQFSRVNTLVEFNLDCWSMNTWGQRDRNYGTFATRIVPTPAMTAAY
jgi:hypothetical protein